MQSPIGSPRLLRDRPVLNGRKGAFPQGGSRPTSKLLEFAPALFDVRLNQARQASPAPCNCAV